ncbi:MAG: Na+/H+ antiporter NhaA [Acidimicrobiia bacterium]|nr:Na+/H+ antiporter NhaA [Acidimicrobiia bacterium]
MVIGIVLGLIVGKTVGVFGLRVGSPRRGSGWVACRRGPPGRTCSACRSRRCGFTVALFITTLAFDQSTFTDSAKIGVFLASIVAGIGGFTILRVLGRSRTRAGDPVEETFSRSPGSR